MVVAVTNQVLKCTHRVSDAAAGFEVSMTVQLNDARGQVWDVQEAMYYCERFLPEVRTPTDFGEHRNMLSPTKLEV